MNIEEIPTTNEQIQEYITNGLAIIFWAFVIATFIIYQLEKRR